MHAFKGPALKEVDLAVSTNWGFSFVGAAIFVVYVWAPNYWKLPFPTENERTGQIATDRQVGRQTGRQPHR